MPRDMQTGVPLHGYVLSPTLYNLYINDTSLQTIGANLHLLVMAPACMQQNTKKAMFSENSSVD
jgi:hypothetical protein